MADVDAALRRTTLNNETIGHLRIVRDGDDCHWHKNTSNLFMFDGNIYRDQRNGYNPFGVTSGGMLPEYTTTVTPVRLEEYKP